MTIIGVDATIRLDSSIRLDACLPMTDIKLEASVMLGTLEGIVDPNLDWTLPQDV